jgi:hypothetical protein
MYFLVYLSWERVVGIQKLYAMNKKAKDYNSYFHVILLCFSVYVTQNGFDDLYFHYYWSFLIFYSNTV